MNLNHKNKGKNLWAWFKRLFWVVFLLRILGWFIKGEKLSRIKNNFKEFINEEEKEIKELKEGKEGLKKFCCDCGSIFKEFFIPHECNDHKPRILRTRSLSLIVLSLVLVKALVGFYLFLIYPSIARMTADINSEIITLTNKSRVENNLPALSLNFVLVASAKTKAEDMLKNDYFAHQSPNGYMPWQWIDRNQYAYIFAGENLAMNFSSALSAHRALMQSPSHRKNILNTKYQDIGIAVASGKINGQETNVLVEFFGAAKSTSLASAVNTSSQTTAANIAMEENKEMAPTSPPTAGQTTKVEPTEVVPMPKVAEANTENAENKIMEDSPSETGDDIPAETAAASKTQSGGLAEVGEQGEARVAGEENQPENNPPLDLDDNLQAIFPVGEVAISRPQEEGRFWLASKLVIWSKYLFMFALAFMVFALTINIIIKLRIQHKPVIIQSLLVILFIVGLLTVKVHILESLIEKIFIA